jgi:hypothetical protein
MKPKLDLISPPSALSIFRFDAGQFRLDGENREQYWLMTTTTRSLSARERDKSKSERKFPQFSTIIGALYKPQHGTERNDAMRNAEILLRRPWTAMSHEPMLFDTRPETQQRARQAEQDAFSFAS